MKIIIEYSFLKIHMKIEYF